MIYHTYPPHRGSKHHGKHHAKEKRHHHHTMHHQHHRSHVRTYVKRTRTYESSIQWEIIILAEAQYCGSI
ncbi:hypothetical protein M0802_006379 [Mischocyttarus mexicanus]|nr:hypothetical protein M0802_006379 [Mischocyttarus mexicanus]